MTLTYNLLSQLAGILAGFAFAALITILGIIIVSRRDFEDRLPEIGAFTGTLFLASLALGSASYNYLFLVGEEVVRGRALSEGLLADASMTIAIMLLILAVVQLIEFARLDEWVPFVRPSVLVMPLFYYLVLVPDAGYLQDPKIVASAHGLPLGVAYGMILVTVMIGIAGGWKRRANWRSETLKLSAAIFGLVACLTAGIQIINAQSFDFVLPAFVVGVVHAAVAISLGCVVAFIVATREHRRGRTGMDPIDQSASEPHGNGKAVVTERVDV